MTEDQKNNSGLWLSIAEIARRKGVSRQAVAERVARFEEAGSITTKPGKANAKLVNLAEFDRLAQEQTSFAKQSGARNGSGGSSRRGDYNEAITEKAQYDAALKRIELGEKLKELIPVEDVEGAAQEAAQLIVTIIEGLARRTADIESAAKAGTTRTLLKSIIFDMRTRVAAEMKKLGQREQRGSTWPSVQDELPLPGAAWRDAAADP